MPKIEFVKPFPAIEVESGANLMRSLLNAGRPVATSCGGKGACTKCQIKVIKGKENLSLETNLERGLRKRDNIGDDRRISCQTFVFGDIVVDATYW